MAISAQVSLYPLGQADLLPAIEALWKALGAHGLALQPGPMSTLVEGEAHTVFKALADAFEAAAHYGATVMAVTVSNACAAAPPEEKVVHHG
jgi:uncharacterized protein YqgV (UPF0045/DUF77 family)